MFTKKVLGVIISVEVATHRPLILFLLVDSILVDCCLSFTHSWIGMAPSYKEMLLEQRKRALGLLLSWSKDGVLPWGSLPIVTDEIGGGMQHHKQVVGAGAWGTQRISNYHSRNCFAE